MVEKVMGHRDLLVWQLALKFSIRIYEITDNFPKEEKYGIIQQMRRAGISVPSNIAEGAGRKYPKEFIYFLNVSKGSLSEIETQLYIAKSRNMIPSIENEIIMIVRLRKLIIGLIDSLHRKL